MKKRLFKTESIVSKKQQQGFEKGTLYKVKFPKEAEQFSPAPKSSPYKNLSIDSEEVSRRSENSQQQIEIKEVIDFIQTNHGNLVRLRKTITWSVLYRNDTNGNVTNLSKFSFTKGRYNLLNINLNFVKHLDNTIRY